MSIKKRLNNKKAALLGLGSENIALLRYCLDKGVEAEFTICDAKKKKDLGEMAGEFNGYENIKWRLGREYDQDLAGFDLVSRIAGYPLGSQALARARQSGAEITSPAKLFFELCPSQNIIGVTGSKGKGTTSGLVCEILQTANRRYFWGGNIGIPLFSFIDKIKPGDHVVLELSSFQLEDLEQSPHIAVITNLFREHLAPADPANPNFHRSMDDYCLAKLNIIAYQKRGDLAVLNKNIKQYCAPNKRLNLGRGKKAYFGRSDLPSRLPGRHNQENIAAAVEVAKFLGIKQALVRKAVKKFKSLPHRLELAGESRGIRYYDDSFATTPEAGITALESFDSPIILLAGGADKGSNFQKFARAIKKRAKFTILLQGKGTQRLKRELKRIGCPDEKMEAADSLKAAMRLANEHAESGDIVLLSTGCASFGMFKDYKERGDMFKAEVKKRI